MQRRSAVWVSIFLLAALFQYLFIYTFRYIDFSMWAHQSEYVVTHNPLQFDTTQAYGHPGGVVIIGTILFHEVPGISYVQALLIFLSVSNALIITLCTYLCYLLQKNLLWCVLTFIILTYNRLSIYATPPSATVSFLIVLSALYTLYLSTKNKIENKHVVWWGITSGLAISARFDIGSLMTVVFLLALIRIFTFRQMLYALIVSVLVFFASDPFMWFMPVQHIVDIFTKILYHYDTYTIIHLTALHVARLLSVTLVSIVVSLVAYHRGGLGIISSYFYKILLISTVFVFTIYLTSHYQAERYFLPLILTWEVLLPLYLFRLFPQWNPTIHKVSDISYTCLCILVLIIFGIMLV